MHYGVNNRLFIKHGAIEPRIVPMALALQRGIFAEAIHQGEKVLLGFKEKAVCIPCRIGKQSVLAVGLFIFRIPCVHPADDIRNQAAGKRLRVTVIAPVGKQQALSAVGLCPFCGRADVFRHAGGTAEQAVPGGGAGSDIIAQPRFMQAPAALLKGMIMLIAPFQYHKILRQTVDQLRVVHHNIVPEQRRFPVFVARQVIQLQKIPQIDLPAPQLFAFCAGVALPKANFIAADIQHARGKRRQKRAPKLLNKRQRLRMQGVNRAADRSVVPGDPKMRERGQMHPGFHMSEAVLVRHKLDKALGAVAVQRLDLCRRIQNLTRGEILQSGIIKHNGIEIQLHMIVFQIRQKIHGFVNRLHA